jgi:hypothetical protein
LTSDRPRRGSLRDVHQTSPEESIVPPRRARRLTRAIIGALAVAVAALATSAAGARPIDAIPDSVPPTPPAAGSFQADAPAATVIRSTDNDFDWGSAGIGAGAAGALVLLSIGGVRIGSRAGVRAAR